MMYTLKDGWREESTEGPYTETLQTKGDYRIFRLYGDDKFTLEMKNGTREMFESLESAKARVNADVQ